MPDARTGAGSGSAAGGGDPRRDGAGASVSPAVSPSAGAGSGSGGGAGAGGGAGGGAGSGSAAGRGAGAGDSRRDGIGAFESEGESPLAQAAQWLERITGDPLADAVRGRVRVIAVSAPTGRRRYQECTVELTVTAGGAPPHTLTQVVVLPRSAWPKVGDVLVAAVSPSRPDALEVDWSPLARR